MSYNAEGLWAKQMKAFEPPAHDRAETGHGADSIDSTTWAQRNGCLRHHVTEYRARTILEDFA